MKQVRILIVDDYTTMRRIIRNMLEQIGFERLNIDEAVSGAQALHRLSTGVYNLCIVDYGMPGMNGLQLLAQIRETEGLKELPFLMLTAESSMDPQKAIKEAGMANYIVKPFNRSALKFKIDQLLNEENSND